MELTADERLSDYICEYIDGKMDPVVEEVFEEYMGQNTTVYNFVQRSLWSKNVLNQLPAYSTNSNFESELHYRVELERQIEQLMDLGLEREENQTFDYKNRVAGIFQQRGENNTALWITLMYVMLMLIAASGYWLW